MDKEKIIASSIEDIIARLYGKLDYSSGKEKLAKLRNSLGRTDQVGSFSFLFEMMPEELLGHTKELSDEEKAMIWTLQFYALLQQGRTECVHQRMESYQNLGTSLSKLRMSGESEALDRRFNAMILSDTAEEFQVHLRHILRLYKSVAKAGAVDFARLAADIYRYIHWEDGKAQIRLSWSREYYKTNAKGEENHD
jgi:CRISPR system Cascade subunit CasB